MIALALPTLPFSYLSRQNCVLMPDTLTAQADPVRVQARSTCMVRTVFRLETTDRGNADEMGPAMSSAGTKRQRA